MVEEEDVKSGYTIKLSFSPNPFFANERLEKTLSYAEDGELTLSATTVDWKPPGSAEADASSSASSRKRPRGTAAAGLDAATFLRAFLWVEGQVMMG